MKKCPITFEVSLKFAIKDDFFKNEKMPIQTWILWFEKWLSKYVQQSVCGCKHIVAEEWDWIDQK